MNRWASALVLSLAVGVFVAPCLAQGTLQANGHNRAAMESFAGLPLAFEPVPGSHRSEFLSRGPEYQLLLSSRGIDLVLGNRDNQTVVNLRLLNSRPDTQATPRSPLPGVTNYYFGNDPAKWRTNIPNYAEVKYEQVYPGINLVYYGNQGELEHDFVIAPGADYRQIAWKIDGARKVISAPDGDMSLTVSDKVIHLRKPVIYESFGKSRQLMKGGYSYENGILRFRVEHHDETRTLIIDPIVGYSTYLGGSQEAFHTQFAKAIAADDAGNAYIAGMTDASDFPTTPQAYQTAFGGTFTRGFVTKISADGSHVLYSTYLGGSGSDQINGIAVDSAGNAYVAGSTSSLDFPVTPGAFGTSGGSFLTKLSPDGSRLIYSGRIGSGSGASAVALDAQGNSYLAGTATSIPIVGGFQQQMAGGYDAYVAKISSDGTSIVYSSFLGGTGGDVALGAAVDQAGSLYVTGYTNSADFPVTSGALQTSVQGTSPFVAKVSPDGSALTYATYLGKGSAGGIDVDSGGNAYITGTTTSATFPVTPGAFETQLTTLNFFEAAFVSKLNPTGTGLVYSTYLEAPPSQLGNVFDQANSIKVDAKGQAYVTGQTCDTAFPLAQPLQSVIGPPFTNYCDVFITEFAPDGSSLRFSTFWGAGVSMGEGIALDQTGNIYVTGLTYSSTFPVVNAIQPTKAGVEDAFVLKLQADTTPPVLQLPATIITSATMAAGAYVTYTVSATDDQDPSPQVSCSRLSGQQFPIGTTTVSCTATDASGNSSSGSFTVTVVVAPPVLHLPGPITVDASVQSGNGAGAPITFYVSATDLVDPNVFVFCNPQAGASVVFAVGTSTVTCTATNSFGVTATGAFTVTVLGAADQLAELLSTIQSFNLQQGISNSLDSKVANVQSSLSAALAGDRATTCNQLASFENEVNAESGKQLTSAQAAQLISAAVRIGHVIGYQGTMYPACF